MAANNNYELPVQRIQAAVFANALPDGGFIRRVPPWMTGGDGAHGHVELPQNPNLIFQGTRSSSAAAYRPRAVSLGPFHHGAVNLMPMEDYKMQAMTRLAVRSGRQIEDYVGATDVVAGHLRRAYVGLEDRWLGRTFVDMMARDGCFLLEMALRIYDATPGRRAPGFAGAPRDNQALFMWESIRKDVVAIENQLPLLLLMVLEIVRDPPNINVTREYINSLVLQFLSPPEGTGVPQGLALHPLDLLHRCFCIPADVGNQPVQNQVLHNTMPCALELSKAGIAFKKSTSRKLYDVTFIRGRMRPQLNMPVFRVRNDTERYLFNLIAFEELHPAAGHVITSYLYFMNNMVDTGEDVALLRSAGIIVHTFGSDQAVADLFNTVYTGSLSPYSLLHGVQREVTAHCNRRCNCAMWWATFYRTYLTDAVVFTSFVVAIIVLVLTFLQTWFTIYPYYHPRS